MNSGGPLSAEEAGEREVHQEISKLGRVENIRVVKSNEGSQASDTELLIVCGEFRKGGMALGVDMAFVS